MEHYCPICDGDGLVLGILGNLKHFRCRECGADFNVNLAPDLKVGQVVYTDIKGVRTECIITEIREPNTVVNWTSADQGKRVYKLKANQGLARVSRKYYVRQAAQLSERPL